MYIYDEHVRASTGLAQTKAEINNHCYRFAALLPIKFKK